MSRRHATVESVVVTRHELTSADAPELATLFGLDRLPLRPSRVEVVIAGAPTAVVNALRRALVDEVEGHALHAAGFDTALTTDVFMLPQFVCRRIALLPLRAPLPLGAGALRLALDVTNTGAAPLTVYAGDLTVTAGAADPAAPLYNPTTELAFLQPGARLVVRDIVVAAGFGRDDAVFNVARRAAFTHLDLEQHSDDAVRRADGVAADESGYLLSSLVADPRRHRLTVVLPATGDDPADARAVVADACVSVVDRLRLVEAAVLAAGQAGAPGGTSSRVGAVARFDVVALESGLAEGHLRVPGETHTVGELLRRAVFDAAPDVANVSYVAAAGDLALTLSAAEDVAALLLRAVRAATADFDSIRRGIMDAT
jgi:hypothetical protein